MSRTIKGVKIISKVKRSSLIVFVAVIVLEVTMYVSFRTIEVKEWVATIFYGTPVLLGILGTYHTKTWWFTPVSVLLVSSFLIGWSYYEETLNIKGESDPLAFGFLIIITFILMLKQVAICLIASVTSYLIQRKLNKFSK